MPRTARVDAPGLIHHVISRGIERRAVFLDDKDRSEYLRRMERVYVECDLRCLAWALMGNHTHSVVQTGRAPLALAMARLNTGYAIYFNARYDRIGHVFHNRYRSILVDDEAHLLALIRYVHRNPLRAGVVGDLAALACYPWTGYAALMGHGSAPFLDVEAVLGRFSADRITARERLDRWMGEAAVPAPPEPIPMPPSVAQLVEWVSGALGHSALDLRSSERRGTTSEARSALAYLACTVLHRGSSAVARELGVSRTAIERAARRGESIVRSSDGLTLLEAALLAKGR